MNTQEALLSLTFWDIQTYNMGSGLYAPGTCKGTRCFVLVFSFPQIIISFFEILFDFVEIFVRFPQFIFSRI